MHRVRGEKMIQWRNEWGRGGRGVYVCDELRNMRSDEYVIVLSGMGVGIGMEMEAIVQPNKVNRGGEGGRGGRVGSWYSCKKGL